MKSVIPASLSAAEACIHVLRDEGLIDNARRLEPVMREEMDRLVAGLEGHPEVAILCDEIYSRLLYDAEEHVSILQYESLADRAICLDGWSKTYAMTGWRLGWGVWPEGLVAEAERVSGMKEKMTRRLALAAMQTPVVLPPFLLPNVLITSILII